MDSLVHWKKRRDRYQESDKVSGMGDSVEGLQDREDVGLTGSPKEVKFIMKDETNAGCMRKMRMKRWI